MSDEDRSAPDTDLAADGSRRDHHTAGAFDIRNIIGGLLAVYGLILLLMGVLGDPETDKTGGVNANLWAGLGLLVAGGAFVLWTRLRPVEVPDGGAESTPPER